jgi:hypothetical protein
MQDGKPPTQQVNKTQISGTVNLNIFQIRKNIKNKMLNYLKILLRSWDQKSQRD